MIAHGHVDVMYVHYELDFYLGDVNHIVGLHNFYEISTNDQHLRYVLYSWVLKQHLFMREYLMGRRCV